VGGTGLSRSLVDEVRQGSPLAGDRITPGPYLATSYGPPWGGIQGAGISTSGGLPIGGGAPRWYMIATAPAFIQQGTFVYIWPNPFGWRGPFFAADTGGAIIGRRIDFYDWRGRTMQDRWGARSVTVSDRRLEDGSPSSASSGDTSVKNAANPAGCGDAGDLTVSGTAGLVVVAPGADRPGVPTQQVVLAFLRQVAGILGRTLIVTTGSNHSQYASSGNESDHWVGLAGDLGSVANGFAINGQGGTHIAAAALRAAGVHEQEAWNLADAGGGHNVCFRGWRIQVIWRTGGHYDHVHVGLRHGCAFTGVQSFQI
jgi:3D (Asp-Asp-Asp) domain-containing protein